MEKILSNISLAKHTTFGLGGPASFFVRVKTVEEMQSALQFAKEKELKVFILGKGSNILFDDRGYNGLVILNRIDFCHYEGCRIKVGAGYPFSVLGIKSSSRQLSGLEFAAGIPGSVGGAIFMNAGAGTQSTFDVLETVRYLNSEGVIEEFSKENLEFSYRFSSFQKKKGVILSASFLLKPEEKAKEKQIALIEYRTKSQPYGEHSAGCVFKNPTSVFSAGYLIEKCQLKGFRLGGAKVSEKHANFIVAEAGCKSKDVLDLIEHIQKVIHEKENISLRTEICYIPYDYEGNIDGKKSRSSYS